MNLRLNTSQILSLPTSLPSTKATLSFLEFFFSHPPTPMGNISAKQCKHNVHPLGSEALGSGCGSVVLPRCHTSCARQRPLFWLRDTVHGPRSADAPARAATAASRSQTHA